MPSGIYERIKILGDKIIYKNRHWLENKYWKENLSTEQMSKISGVRKRTIQLWMKGFNILLRSRGRAIHLSKINYCNLSQEAIEWINGELLGDGCLSSRSQYSARFQYASKYREYIKYISDTLRSFGIKQSGIIKKYYIKNTDTYIYHYASCSYPKFMLLKNRWYSYDNKKILPRDLDLKPLTCRQWYIGDGSLSHPKDARSSINIATCGFSIPDVNWLVQELIKLGFKATRQPSRNTIHILVYSTKDFLDYIGKCPVECYTYKFDYSGLKL